MADFFPGFDHKLYRWWDRVAVWQGHCTRGFNFHAMGLQRGRHALGKQSSRSVVEDVPAPASMGVQNEITR